MKAKHWTIALAALGLISCEKEAGPKNATAGAPPGTANAKAAGGTVYGVGRAKFETLPIDASTPDRLLKSLWGLEDERRRLACLANDELINLKLGNIGANDLAGDVTYGAKVKPYLTGQASSSLDKRWRQLSSTDCTKLIQAYPREINEIKTETESRAIALVTIKNVTQVPPDASKSSDNIVKWRTDGEKFRYEMTKIDNGWKIEQIYSKRYSGDEWAPLYKPSDLTPDVPWYVVDPLT